jgi:glycosyltransferase involved in cell wall biosynthesis
MSFEVTTPHITVVIPAFCEEQVLHRCLLSVQSQTHQPYEVIVCDDGSPHSLLPIVQEFSHTLPIKYVRLDNTGGAAGPRNVAVENASGEWVAFLDADDAWQPQKLMSMQPFLCRSADVVYHRLSIHPRQRRPYLQKLVGWNTLTEADVPFDLLSQGNPIPTSGALIRRSLYCDAGGMRTDDVVVEDYDFWIRIAWTGAHFRFIPLVLGQYFQTPGSLSSPNLARANMLRATIEQQLDRFSGHQRVQVQSFMEFSTGIQFLWAGLYLQAEQHLARARNLRLLKQRLSRRAKLLGIRAKLLFSSEI